MIKTVSIGNIAMGGTGKTPHTIMLANKFQSEGKNVTILSRGYKGLLGDSLNVISDGHKIFYSPPEASDEAFMMAKNCDNVSVITGVDRNKSLKYAIKNFNSNLAILDDSYQYKHIDKDIEILLLDSKNPISTGFIFPFGYLREMPSAIKRADIVIFTRSETNTIPEKAIKYLLPHQKVFFSKYTKPKIVRENQLHDLSIFKGKKVAAYSALADNNSFHESLKVAGINVAYFQGYRDHTYLSNHKLDKFINKALAASCTEFLTTEKDYVKLSATYTRIFSYTRVDIQLNNENGLIKAIKEKI